MEGRTVTNILLAVIAGVLLFSRETMVGGIQWVLILGVVIFVIYLVLWGIGALIREAVKFYRGDYKPAPLLHKLHYLLGLAFILIAFPLMGYALWLKSYGVPDPLDAAIDSPLGQVWMVVFFGGLGAIALLAGGQGLRWLYEHRSEVPDYTSAFGRWLGNAWLAPILFPIREWRLRTQQGAGIATRLASTVYVTVVSSVLWLFALLVVFALSNRFLTLAWDSQVSSFDVGGGRRVHERELVHKTAACSMT
jgi:hypothetical protein